MKESYMVLGLGRFGEAVSKSLYAKGYEVLAIDEDEEIINEIQNHVTHAIVGDCTDESVLKAVGARNFDGAIVAVGGKIETSILSTVLLRELGVNFIVARAATELHGRILKKVGADRVVLPERDMGIKFVQSLASNHIVDMIELSEDHSIVEVRRCPVGLVKRWMKSICVKFMASPLWRQKKGAMLWYRRGRIIKFRKTIFWWWWVITGILIKSGRNKFRHQEARYHSGFLCVQKKERVMYGIHHIRTKWKSQSIA